MLALDISDIFSKPNLSAYYSSKTDHAFPESMLPHQGKRTDQLLLTLGNDFLVPVNRQHHGLMRQR